MSATPSSRPAPHVPVTLLLFFTSGVSALVYQVIWQRALLDLYGTNVESTDHETPPLGLSATIAARVLMTAIASRGLHA